MTKPDVFKNLLTVLMTDLKKQNEYSTWKNLTLGLSVVVLVVFLSISYFNRISRSLEITPLSDQDTNLVKEMPKKDTKPNTQEVKQDNKVVVQEGEGLWHVAQRVCGNGEAYSALAEANNLTIDSEVFVGQELVLQCK